MVLCPASPSLVQDMLPCKYVGILGTGCCGWVNAVVLVPVGSSSIPAESRVKTAQFLLDVEQFKAMKEKLLTLLAGLL